MCPLIMTCHELLIYIIHSHDLSLDSLVNVHQTTLTFSLHFCLRQGKGVPFCTGMLWKIVYTGTLNVYIFSLIIPQQLVGISGTFTFLTVLDWLSVNPLETTWQLTLVIKFTLCETNAQEWCHFWIEAFWSAYCIIFLIANNVTVLPLNTLAVMIIMLWN